MGRKLLLLLVAAGLTGCVEHILQIGILPDGSSHLIFSSKGDRTDVFDDDLPHPGDWMHDTTWTMDNEDTIWVLTSQYFSADSQFLIGPQDNPILDITRSVKPGYLSTTFTLTVRFHGREVYSRYPQVGPVLLDEAPLDSTQWQRDVLTYIYSRAITDVGVPESARQSGITPERLIHHLDLFIANEYEPVPGQLPDHARWLPGVLQPFKHQLPIGFSDSVVIALQPYITELERLQNLKDDSFVIKSTLPGKLIFTNADSLQQDTLIWDVKLADFIQDDVRLLAESVVVSGQSVQRWILFGTIILLGVLVILFSGIWLVRRFQRSP
ncbi:MAG: hypothetical protein GXO90_00280 [FCB group bacterium]|nr:hypothetical protein [FCB group bacterium]